MVCLCVQELATLFDELDDDLAAIKERGGGGGEAGEGASRGIRMLEEALKPKLDR